MKDDVWKFKLWWAWQDREHEHWLAERSRLGLHLRSVSMLGLLHRFAPGAPAEVCYRWDFQANGGKSDYRQLFADAGWHLVGDVPGGWLCWSRPVIAGQQAEIFTDRDSLRNKYRSLLGVLSVTTLPLLPLVLINRGLWTDIAAGGRPAIAAAGIVAMGLSCFVLGAYGSLRIWRRMQEI
jgi:hypothetical protein